MGISGSGKTTVLRDFASRNGYTYLCPDDIRKELLGNAIEQSQNEKVWEDAYRRVARMLSEGKTIVFDATFTRDDQRKRFLAFVRSHGADRVQGVYVDAPLAVAKERNRMRERQIPDYAIDRMHAQIHKAPPDVTDGFDSLFTIDEHFNLVDVAATGEGEISRKKFR